jgi:Mu-like prophage I protein
MKTQEFTMREPHALTQGEAIDPASVGVKLIGPAKWQDGTPVTLVWIQVAETGAWKGHGAGPFEMTSATFSEIVTNFNARGLPIQWDQEHASEADPTSGTIPITGAPAQGWIHRLDNRGPAGLWALTEWLDTARDGIKAGKFAWCSPAVRFGCKDGVTGKEIGARLTSVAITGQPFLTGLEQLVAASDKSADDLLPHHHATNLRRALADHDCSKGKCMALAHCAKSFLGCYDDADSGDGDTMPMTNRLVRAEGQASRAILELRDARATIDEQSGELVALRADKARRDEAELLEEVDTAFRTHKDKRKLSDRDKPLMLRLARADRGAFRSMYPRVELEHRHLLRDLVPPEPKPRLEDVEPPTPMATIERLMKDEGLTFAEAQIAAAKMRPTAGLDPSAYRQVAR